MTNPIRYTAQDVTVSLYTGGWPRSLEIECGWPRGNLKLHGTQQIRALHWVLGEIIAADPHPDDRPQK